MADKKVSALTLLDEAPAAGDLFLIVDVSEGTNKKVAFSKLATDISGKVDKISGKGLSTNDLTDELKIGYDTAVSEAHTHSNETALDNISGVNTGDEDATSITTKLGITTLSGSNTGDQTLNELLPTQTNNSGKFLKTNGSSASWDTPAGGGGAGVTSVTYADFMSLVASDGLTPGQQYLITDYATKHYIVDGNKNVLSDTLITGVTEPLLVLAVDVDKIDKEVKSALYPQDIIYYDPFPDNWLLDISFAIQSGADITQVDTITLTGTSGTANIIGAGGLTKLVTFSSDLTTTADNFVTAFATDYLAQGIVITSNVADLIFTANIAGVPFTNPAIANVSGNLNGTITHTNLNATEGIIPGFKGVIYFRHDTLLDNYMGYDFRNVKFRRWKTNVDTWSDAITYNKYDFVNYSGFIYQSLVNTNLNNTPSNGSAYWVILLDLSFTEYYNAKPTNWNGITSGTDYNDFKTFAEGSGSATYQQCCRSNHFGSFKDDYITDITGDTILMNNVFFLQDEDSFSVYANIIESKSYNNTFVDIFHSNTIGNDFYNNIIGSGFDSNKIGNNFYSNIIANYFDSNIIGSYFHSNKVANGFNGNTIGNDFQGNMIANTLYGNMIANNFHSNTIGNDFQGNMIANNFYNNLIGNTFHDNTIGNDFNGNTIGDGFTKNLVQDDFNIVASVDFTSANHVYASYNKTIQTREDGTAKLSYINNSDVLVIADATS